MGAAIPNATNAILLLTNIQPTAAGLYSVRVQNNYGFALSTNATLTVITSPFITAQPLSVAEIVGSNVTLVVTADGAPPLHYQWRFGNSLIPNATNRTLGVDKLAGRRQRRLFGGNYKSIRLDHEFQRDRHRP
jgi:hypothetical protein